MAYCNKCGANLEDGQVCTCQLESIDHQENHPPVSDYSPSNNSSSNYSEDFSGKGLIDSIIHFFMGPVTAVRNGVKANSWKNGIACILIYVLCIGLIGTYNHVSSELKSYNKQIESAKKTYEQYSKEYKDATSDYSKENYKEYMDDAKKSIDDAKEDRTDLLKNGDFYKDTLKTLWNLIINPLVFMSLLVLLLFVAGKILNGNGTIKSILSGVGLSSIIYLISVVLIPLLVKIPKMGFLFMLVPIVTYIFALLVYVTFEEIYDFESDKSVAAVFGSYAIATLIVGLLLGNGVNSSMDQLNSLMDILS